MSTKGVLVDRNTMPQYTTPRQHQGGFGRMERDLDPNGETIADK